MDCLKNYKKRRNIRKMRRFFILLLRHLKKWPRSLVNRASDSGSEGRAFESHRGHEEIP